MLPIGGGVFTCKLCDFAYIYLNKADRDKARKQIESHVEEHVDADAYYSSHTNENDWE